MEYDFDPSNLPHDLLAAIGLMTTCASQTEGFVGETIAGCLSVDVEYGVAVTTHLSMPLRLDVLKAVAEIRIDDLDVLDELDALLDRIDKAFVSRNAVAHRLWCRDPDTGNVFMVKKQARGRVEVDIIPMSVRQVKSDALLLYQAGMDLFSFLQRHNLLPLVPASFPAVRPRGHKSKAARKKRREAKLKERRD